MKHRRTGRIARLPKEWRDVVCLMIQDGATYKQIIEKLGEHGAGMHLKNFTNWKKGGYQDWLAEQARLTDMQAKREFALATVKASSIENLHETALQLAAAQLYEVLTDFDLVGLKTSLADKPADYTAIVSALARLSKTSLDFEKHRDHIQEQKRKIESQIGKARTDGGLTPETLAKIEEALNLL